MTTLDASAARLPRDATDPRPQYEHRRRENLSLDPGAEYLRHPISRPTTAIIQMQTTATTYTVILASPRIEVAPFND
jgi:hypothetical protein